MLNHTFFIQYSKVHGANMGPTRVLSAPGGPHVGPINLAIWDMVPKVIFCNSATITAEGEISQTSPIGHQTTSS